MALSINLYIPVVRLHKLPISQSFLGHRLLTNQWKSVDKYTILAGKMSYTNREKKSWKFNHGKIPACLYFWVPFRNKCFTCQKILLTRNFIQHYLEGRQKVRWNYSFLLSWAKYKLGIWKTSLDLRQSLRILIHDRIHPV